MNNDQSLEKKNLNIKIFPFYKMLSWDLLFYYAIIFLYLTRIKGLTAAQVVLADTVYSISMMLFQIPGSKIVDRLGKKYSVIIANIFMCIATTILLTMNSYIHLIIAYIIQGIGYAVKGIAEDIILYDSLPRGRKRGKLFSKINGKASSYYYYIDAISSVATGYLFVLNPYIPLVICLICNIISTILSCLFRHTNDNYKQINSRNKETTKLKEVVLHMIKSKRLFCLVMIYALISGLLYSLISMRSSIFEQINISAEYFGIIYAVLQIITGLSVRAQNIIQNKFRNKTLTVLTLPMTITCVIIGILANIAGNNKAIILLIVFIFMIQGLLKGSFRSLIVRYLTNFTNHKVRTKLASMQNLLYHMISIVLGLICSGLLAITTTSNVFIIVGSIMTVLVALLLFYMRDKVGLEPEQYTEEDLKYSSVELKKE